MGTLGQRLRILRQARDWTLGQLALRSGISASQLSRLERGERVDLLVQNAAQIARALNTTIDYLAGLTNEPTSTVAETRQPYGIDDMPQQFARYYMLSQPSVREFLRAFLKFMTQEFPIPEDRPSGLLLPDERS